MTPEEKIAALVEHIKKEFPKGCEGIECENCPVDTLSDVVENDVCVLLRSIRMR